MINERDIIPFEFTEIQPEERVLIFTPHPDDETIGCGGTIALHTANGNAVKIVNVTDGGFVLDKERISDPKEYIKIRQNELKAAANILNVADIEFWGYRDRALFQTTELVDRCGDCMTRFKPTLIYAPAPTEINPDHRVTAHAIWQAAGRLDFPVKIAFYETLCPIRPNTLINITSVIEQKKKALQAYPSQLDQNHYERILGLNQFRTLSLLNEKYEYVEAFWTVDTATEHFPSLALIYLQQQQVDVIHKIRTGPRVSIIIRTKNRPHFLEEALQSIMTQTYDNLEVIVVNNAGEPVDPILEKFKSYLDIRLLNHSQDRGRGGSAVSGLNCATGTYFMFLDDDDLLYPEHCAILIDFLEHHNVKVAYTDTCCAFYERDETTGDYQLIEKKVLYSNDFNRSSFLFENLTPNMCVMFHRDVLNQVSYAEDMVYYDDWDFWVRMSRHYDFVHIRQVTSEYRIFSDRKGMYAHDNSPERDYWLGYAFEKHRHLISGEDYVMYQHQIREKIAHYESKIDEMQAQINALREHANILEDFAIRVRKTLPFRIYKFFRDLIKNNGKREEL